MIENKSNKHIEKQIELYANGRLNQEEIDELWAALIQDEYYLDYMKSVVNLKAITDRKQKFTARKTFDFPRIVRYTTAAAIVLIAGIVGVMNYSNTQQSFGVNPIGAIGLDVVRNADGVSENISNEVIRTAIRMASEGEAEQAIILLNDELLHTSDAQLIADIALTLGSIYYNSGNYEKAIENFSLIVEQPGINVLTLEKGYWFLGNAQFQLDYLAAAETSFQKAYELNGAYSRVAKLYIDALNKVI